METTTGDANRQEKPRQSFFRVFAGIGAMSFLTYMGEYSAFIIVLVYLSDKFVETFGLGDF